MSCETKESAYAHAFKLCVKGDDAIEELKHLAKVYYSTFRTPFELNNHSYATGHLRHHGTPFVMAVQGDSIEIVKSVVESGGINLVKEQNWSQAWGKQDLLQYAVNVQAEKVINYLINEFGCNVVGCNEMGEEKESDGLGVFNYDNKPKYNPKSNPIVEKYQITGSTIPNCWDKLIETLIRKNCTNLFAYLIKKFDKNNILSQNYSKYINIAIEKESISTAHTLISLYYHHPAIQQGQQVPRLEILTPKLTPKEHTINLLAKISQKIRSPLELRSYVLFIFSYHSSRTESSKSEYLEEEMLLYHAYDLFINMNEWDCNNNDIKNENTINLTLKKTLDPCPVSPYNPITVSDNYYFHVDISQLLGSIFNPFLIPILYSLGFRFKNNTGSKDTTEVTGEYLMTLCRFGHVQLFEWFIRFCSVPDKDVKKIYEKQTLVDLGIEFGRFELVKVLIDKYNVKTKLNFSLIFWQLFCVPETTITPQMEQGMFELLLNVFDIKNILINTTFTSDKSSTANYSLNLLQFLILEERGDLLKLLIQCEQKTIQNSDHNTNENKAKETKKVTKKTTTIEDSSPILTPNCVVTRIGTKNKFTHGYTLLMIASSGKIEANWGVADKNKAKKDNPDAILQSGDLNSSNIINTVCDWFIHDVINGHDQKWTVNKTKVEKEMFGRGDIDKKRAAKKGEYGIYI
jgi:hypothetical protein